MFSNTYVFGFATVVCVLCSVLIASVSMGLKDQQEANRRRDLQSSILSALNLPEDGHRPIGEEVDQLWNSRVELRFVDTQGQPITEPGAYDLDKDGKLTADDVALARVAAKESGKPVPFGLVYARKDGDRVGAYALPVNGMGLWGPISGYLALDPQGNQVTGTTFFAPKETPGLGAEIQEVKFRSQWVGKKVADSSGNTKPIRVVKGEAKVLCPGAGEIDYCVDGLSGATITSRGVDEMVASALKFYDPYLKRIRSN